jgi:hypothetical protein
MEMRAREEEMDAILHSRFVARDVPPSTREARLRALTEAADARRSMHVSARAEVRARGCVCVWRVRVAWERVTCVCACVVQVCICARVGVPSMCVCVRVCACVCVHVRNPACGVRAQLCLRS